MIRNSDVGIIKVQLNDDVLKMITHYKFYNTKLEKSVSKQKYYISLLNLKK